MRVCQNGVFELLANMFVTNRCQFYSFITEVHQNMVFVVSLSAGLSFCPTLSVTMDDGLMNGEIERLINHRTEPRDQYFFILLLWCCCSFCHHQTTIIIPFPFLSQHEKDEAIEGEGEGGSGNQT